MKLKLRSRAALLFGMMLLLASAAQAQYLMENLGRGVVAGWLIFRSPSIPSISSSIGLRKNYGGI